MGTAVQKPGSNPEGGLFGSVKALATTLLAIAHTRLELLSVDLEEEWVRLGSILIWTFAALFCAGLGLVFAILFLVLLLWDTHRLLALGIPAILFLLAAALSWLVGRGKYRSKPRLFAASLSELAKDCEQIKSRS
jgi:uncharacterized membrane protein YqjE